MKFPVTIYLREEHLNGGFWKTLCTVHDNEALGILERILSSTLMQIKVVTTFEYEEPHPAHPTRVPVVDVSLER